jgi:IMP dehydrogenase
MRENKIGGIPIVDENMHLKGIITNRDLRFQKNLELTVKEVMTKDNLITGGVNTDLKKAEEIFTKNKVEKLPLVDKNNKLVGLITYRDIMKVKSRPNACKDEIGRLRVGAAIGVAKDTIERVKALYKNEVDVVVLDTAHGHSMGVVKMLKEIKKMFPKLEVIVGNIATEEAAKELVKAGADALKVGIGPGSICTTRVIAGVGYPQFSAVYNVAQAIKNSDVPVIADGGIRFTGDIPKAIAAGASSIMAGSLFAGVEESPGETIIYEGRKFKTYRGMGSIEAMEQGSKDRYFQDTEDDIKKLVPEGIVGRVAFKGNLSEVVYQLIGGLRAGMGYCGAKNIATLHKKAKFVRITQSGIRESHPHDVSITKESPNYSSGK